MSEIQKGCRTATKLCVEKKKFWQCVKYYCEVCFSYTDKQQITR